jgi:transposase
MLTTYYTEILLNLEDIRVTKVLADNMTIAIYLEQLRKPHTCPTCGTTTDIVHDYREQTIRDIPMLGKSVVLVVRKRRYACPSCKKRFIENSSLFTRYQRMTNRLQQYIISCFASPRSATSIAKECRCSVSTVMRLFGIVSYPKPQLPPVIAIDEFKGNAGGHKFQCILSDAANKKILDILPSRKAEDLYAYFNEFSMEERSRVKYVVMDLSPLFSSVVRQCFPNAKIVADKFHVVRLANWAMEAIRKEEQKKFAKSRRIYFKKSRWILLKRKAKLKEDEMLQLTNMLAVSERLRKAYLLKEEFYDMINSPDQKQLVTRWKAWQDSVLEANLPSFTKLAETVSKWNKEILIAVATGYSNGFIEGCNNRIKVLKRICYGVRNFERFRNRILYIANS